MVDDAVDSRPASKVISESNVAASSSLIRVLAEMSDCSSENSSILVVDIFPLNIFQSAAARQPKVEPLAVSQTSVLAVLDSPAPVRDVKYSLFRPRVVA